MCPIFDHFSTFCKTFQTCTGKSIVFLDAQQKVAYTMSYSRGASRPRKRALFFLNETRCNSKVRRNQPNRKPPKLLLKPKIALLSGERKNMIFISFRCRILSSTTFLGTTFSCGKFFFLLLDAWKIFDPNLQFLPIFPGKTVRPIFIVFVFLDIEHIDLGPFW